jgi:uncharacterized membrane protein
VESNHLMVVIIVIVVMTAVVLKARYQAIAAREKSVISRASSVSKEQFEQVKQRLAVLERIAVEHDDTLAREIELLKDS